MTLSAACPRRQAGRGARRASSAGPGARAAGRSGRSVVDPSLRPFAPPAPDRSPRSGVYARPAGETASLRSGPCTKCVVRERLRALLADQSGEIRPALHTFYDNLANYERPTTVLRWLDQSRAPAILRELSAGRRPLTHAALDELADGKPVTHLRSILVATGALPPRDEQMARIERWTSRVIADRDDPGEQQLLRAYAVWHLLRRLRCPPGRRGYHPRADRGRSAARQGGDQIARLVHRPRPHDYDGSAGRPGRLAVQRRCQPPPPGRQLRAVGQETEADEPRVPGRQMGRTRRCHRHRGALGATPADCCTTTPSNTRTASPVCWSCFTPNGRPRSAASPSHTSRPAAGTVRFAAGPRTGRAARTTRRPRPRPGRHADGPCRPRRPRHLTLAVPRRATRTPDQRAPHDRTTPPTRHPIRAIPIHRPIPTRHRPARRRSSPACSASTSASPSPGNAPAAATGPTTPPKSAAGQPDEKGIQTVGISDVARGRLPQASHLSPPSVHRPPTATRPNEEYRTPTEDEWDDFLAPLREAQGVGRDVRAGVRNAVSSDEHACVRCSLLRPDPAQRPRLEEIRKQPRGPNHRGQTSRLARRSRRTPSQPCRRQRQTYPDRHQHPPDHYLGTPSRPTNLWRR